MMETYDAPAGYEAARTSAAFFPIEDGARFRLIGPDARDFLNRLVSNEVKALPPGHGVYATMLLPNGRMIADLWAWVLSPDNILAETAASAHDALMSALDQYLIMEDVEIRDEAGALALVSVQGPDARSMAAKALAADVPALEPGAVWESPAGSSDAVVAARDRSGQGGVDVYIPSARMPDLLDALASAGAVAGGADALETLRIEAGIPKWGAELSESVIPLEANLAGVAVSFTTGCYPGQEIIARIHSRGKPARHLVRLAFPDGPPPPGAELRREGKAVGTITSAAVSPRFGGMALGYVRKENDAPGTEVEAGGIHGTVAEEQSA